MQVYSIDGVIPVIDPNAYIHPSAVIIGDVIIEAGCYVGPCASMRGDFGRLILRSGANLQDSCVMHGFPGTDTLVEQNGHIGHGAILHGCHIRTHALIGMNSVIMDNADIGEESIIGASSFVKAGFTCGPRCLVLGSPAKIIRKVLDTEIAWKIQGTAQYHELSVRSLQSMKAVTPLQQIEEHRPKLKISDFAPLQETQLK